MTKLESQDTRTFRRTKALWVLVLALIVGVAPAIGANPIGEGADEAKRDSEMVRATDDLLRELQQFDNVAANARAAHRGALVRIAAQRREHMLKLMERNPKLAASRLFPKGLRDRLPVEAQDLVERDVNVSGHMRAEASDDFRTGRSQTRFYLRTSSEDLEIHLAQGEEHSLLDHVNKKVSLTAARLNGHLLVRQQEDIKEAALSTSGTTSSSTTTSSTLASGARTVSGEKRALVMLLNFPNQPVECTAAEMAPRMFGTTGPTVNRSLFESSRGQVMLTGQVVGPFTIPYGTPNACNKDDWANAADAAAQAAGIDLTQYNLRNYALPRTGNMCPWDGLADIGNPRSWTAGCMATRITAHELGHNLSFDHADLPGQEYGDFSDPMSAAQAILQSGSTYVDHSVPISQFNGANRTMAGWVPSANVQQAITSGSYTVVPIEAPNPTSFAQVLRVYKTDTKEWYYVTFRQATDLDANLLQFQEVVVVNGVPQLQPKYTNRVQIHRARGMLPAHTYLLANLRAGESFSDAVNGITITHKSSGTSATVGVGFNGATCARKAPTVTITSPSQPLTAGTASSFMVQINNKDTPACGPNTFSLSQTLPSGFTGAINNPPGTISDGIFSIEPNSFALGWLNVTAGSSVTTGAYTLTATAVESAAGATPTATSTSMFVINNAPTLTVTSPTPNAVLTGGALLSATASHFSGISAVEFYVDNVQFARLTASPYTVFWPLNSVAKGPHVIRVRATSVAGGATESTVNVTVQ